MQGVVLKNIQYYKLQIPHNSIVFCDPPYEGTSKYKVGKFDHNLFWNWVRIISKDNHQSFLILIIGIFHFMCNFSIFKININSQYTICLIS